MNLAKMFLEKTIKDFKTQGEYLKYKSDLCYWKIKFLKQSMDENTSGQFKMDCLKLINKYENEQMEIDSYLSNIK